MRFMIRTSYGFALLACSAAFLAAATAQETRKPAAGPKEIERTERQRELESSLSEDGWTGPHGWNL